MAKNKYSTNSQAFLASLFSQLRQPDDLAKLTTLLIVLAHIKARSGFDVLGDNGSATLVDKRQKRTQRKEGFNIRTPRSRFL